MLQSLKSAVSRCFQGSILELVQNGAMVIQKCEPKNRCNCMKFGLYLCSGESLYRLFCMSDRTLVSLRVPAGDVRNKERKVPRTDTDTQLYSQVHTQNPKHL